MLGWSESIWCVCVCVRESAYGVCESIWCVCERAYGGRGGQEHMMCVRAYGQEDMGCVRGVEVVGSGAVSG